MHSEWETFQESFIYTIMKKKILFGYQFMREGFSRLENDFELVFPETKSFTREEILERIERFDVFVPSFAFTADQELIDAGKNLQMIANFGAGYDKVDVKYAATQGIVVTNTPNAVLEPTAELCFSILSAAARRIPFYDRYVRSVDAIGLGLYDCPGTDLYGKTLGIFGMGRIGQAVARRAVASGMNIIYHNRKPVTKEIEKSYNARYVNFDELLTASDFLSLNAPATSETYHLIGDAEFEKMKPSAIIVNTARGTLIDEKALIKALTNRVIKGAALDVYDHEPKVADELKQMDNVVLTPHAGTQTIEAKLAIQREVADNIIGFYSGSTISKVN